MEFYVNIYFIFTIALCMVFEHDFIRCVDFAHIAASDTASDDVTNQVTHSICNADLMYICAHFVVEIDEKSSLNGCFQNDLMMIRENGLHFWASLYITHSCSSFFLVVGL